ncbi:MAG: glycosyltransferase family A protein [Armatimonadota bacterium]|nr:glycosyltransferase family A protein [Armatimonadota bacterium]
MSNCPTVSVVMAVYNSAEYLPEAIDSILNQSFQDFELLAVDDGSTDGSADILARYEKQDSRVRVLRQENSGIAASRNNALRHARGNYVAVMDSDDVSLPDRLAKQVALLENNPEIGFCGVSCSFFGDLGEFVGACPPTDPRKLKCRMLFLMTISNTSIMMRRELIAKHSLYYDAGFPVGEDYDLITRLLPHCEPANIPEVLMKIRTHADSITRRYSDEECYRYLSTIHGRFLRIMGIEPSDKELAIHLSMCTHAFPPKSLEDLDDLERWLFRLIDANEKAAIFDREELSALLAERWISMCAMTDVFLLAKWRKFRSSELYAMGRRTSGRSVPSLALLFTRSYVSATLEKSASGRSFKRLVRKGPKALMFRIPILRRSPAN